MCEFESHPAHKEAVSQDTASSSFLQVVDFQPFLCAWSPFSSSRPLRRATLSWWETAALRRRPQQRPPEPGYCFPFLRTATPHELPGALGPFSAPGIVVCWLPGALEPFSAPGSVVSWLPGALGPFSAPGGVISWLSGALGPFSAPGGYRLFRLNPRRWTRSTLTPCTRSTTPAPKPFPSHTRCIRYTP